MDMDPLESPQSLYSQSHGIKEVDEAIDSCKLEDLRKAMKKINPSDLNKHNKRCFGKVLCNIKKTLDIPDQKFTNNAIQTIYLPLLRFLLEQRANMIKVSSDLSQFEASPTMLPMSIRMSLDLLKLFIEFGELAADSDGKTALHFYKNHPIHLWPKYYYKGRLSSAMCFLLNHRVADINAQTYRGRTSIAMSLVGVFMTMCRAADYGTEISRQEHAKLVREVWIYYILEALECLYNAGHDFALRDSYDRTAYKMLLEIDTNELDGCHKMIARVLSPPAVKIVPSLQFLVRTAIRKAVKCPYDDVQILEIPHHLKEFLLLS